MSIDLIPFRILFEVLVGLGGRYFLTKMYQRFHFNAIEQMLILLAVSFILMAIENEANLPFSGLLTVMFLDMMIQRKDLDRSKQFANHYNHF